MSEAGSHRPTRMPEPDGRWTAFTRWCARWRWWIEVVLVIGAAALLSRYLESKDLWITTRYAVYSHVERGLSITGKVPRQAVRTTVLLVGDEAYWKGEPRGRAPISRTYLAELIKSLADKSRGLKVVALDFDLRSEIPATSDEARAGKTDEQRVSAYLGETHQLVQAINYALSKGISVVLPKSVWRKNGEYVEEPDIYEDPALSDSTKGCDFIPGQPCGPLHPDERAQAGNGSITAAATDRTNSGFLYVGYIALPHKTWRLPLPLKIADTERPLNPFSWEIAYAADPDTMRWPDDGSASPFARYLDRAQWTGTHEVDASSSTDDTVAAVLAHAPEVLLIGGDWQTRAYQRGDFADRYDTPAGAIPGVFIHANYAEDFWIKNAPKPVNEWLLMLADCLFALGLALVLRHAEHMPQHTVWKRFQVTLFRLLVVLLAIGVTVLAGFAVMLRWRQFFDLTIVVIGVAGHYAWDSVEWFWREREEVAPQPSEKVMEMRPDTAAQQTIPAQEHISRKKKQAKRAGIRIIVGMIFLGLSTGVTRLHAAAPQGASQQGSQKKSDDQPYKDNDIDVNKPGGARAPKIPWAIVQMVNAKGANIGRATVTSLNSGGVEVKLDLSDLPPGEHALHFHQVPKCDPPDFKSAGPHFNPEKKEHGLKNPRGPHAGDMENFSVGPDGITTATVKDSNVSLGGKNSLLAHGGTALVIHAKADDMKTDPAGNAGDRIACGIVSH